MIEKPRIGSIYEYRPHVGRSVLVKVVGFRRAFAECEGVEDGRHRSCTKVRLFPQPVEEA